MAVLHFPSGADPQSLTLAFPRAFPRFSVSTPEQITASVLVFALLIATVLHRQILFTLRVTRDPCHCVQTAARVYARQNNVVDCPPDSAPFPAEEVSAIPPRRLGVATQFPLHRKIVRS